MSEFYFDGGYIENLERELKLSKTELEMLNKTYEESLEKGSYMDVREIRNECIEKSKHIYEVQEKIQKYYQSLKQLNESKSYELKVSDNVSVTNYPQYNDNVTCTEDNKTDFDIVLDDLQNNLERCTRNNRFLVHALDIPSDMVRSIEIFDDQIILQTYNFLNDNCIPIFIELENIRKNEQKFDVTVEHLNSFGDVMYKEIYRDCVINHAIARSPMDYASDDFTKNTIYISYKDVVFETPGIPTRKRTKNSRFINEDSIAKEQKYKHEHLQEKKTSK